MKTSRLHDISQALGPALPVWPGDHAFECGVTATAGEGSSVTVHRLSMSTQSGTHAECSRHVRGDAPALDDLDLEIFFGPCQLLDVSAVDAVISAGDVLERVPARLERLLLRSFGKADWSRWPASFKAIDPSLIDALAARGCRLIGTDAP